MRDCQISAWSDVPLGDHHCLQTTRTRSEAAEQYMVSTSGGAREMEFLAGSSQNFCTGRNLEMSLGQNVSPDPVTTYGAGDHQAQPRAS